jgi:preprotein translocase subunit SecG
MTGTSKSPPICFEEKNGSLAFGAPAPLTKIFYFILFLFFLLCIIIYIYIGKIKNSIQY